MSISGLAFTLVNNIINSTIFTMNQIPIKQEGPMGCAIACTTFVLNISYQNSLKLFKNGKSKAENIGFLSLSVQNGC